MDPRAEASPPVPPTAALPPVPHLQAKATLLLLAVGALVVAAVLYLMYARGTFEATQRLVLVAEDSEGVSVGMDLTFSGFPIGRVRSIELGEEGNARILVDVPKKDAHWLRESSVFTLVKGLVGGTGIRAYSGVRSDPPLKDGAVRKVLAGDATAEIPKLVAAARDLIQNLTALTGNDSALAGTLGNAQALTGQISGQMKGPQGALGLLLGNEQDAKKVVQTLERTNALLLRLDAMAGRADAQLFGPQGITPRLNEQVLGPKGLVTDSKATVQQLTGLLGDARAALTDARGTLQKLDAVLVEAQGVAANTRSATTDLGALRGEVEASLRKVEHLVNEINRKWPFARDTELKLP
ncbi:ABC-type transport system involved in resistance to organic solvents, periplasmic component [Burkholderiales bacterium JOSHI_001]|nr:ABC-type transport system involved in resistance to organic solvents, periplasmic component [Burkholderiales bacterium JOSHI_001]